MLQLGNASLQAAYSERFYFVVWTNANFIGQSEHCKRQNWVLILE